MISIKIKNIKNILILPDKILTKVKKQKRRAYHRIGGFVRVTMRRLIRKGKKPSTPGSPPKAHTDRLRNIVYNVHSGGVEIGPRKLNQIFFKGDGKPVSGPIPDVLEFGGSIKILEVYKYGRWQRADLRSRRRNAGLKTRMRTVRIKPRPYASAALNIAKKSNKLTGFFKLVGPGRVNSF